MRAKERQANFEILRILSMVMVISLHYLIKGKITIPLSQDISLVNLTAWLLQSFCIVAVNVYVLISGYFLPEAKWGLKKLIYLVAQVWFYSVGVALLCLLLHVGEVRSWDLYDWMAVLFPFQMEHYWFATAYLVMYLFTPVIKAALKYLKKNELEKLIFLLLLFFSVGKSIIPIKVPTDQYGYDFGWFLCLCLIAGYIKIYGIDWFNRIRKGLFLYFIFSAGIFAYSVFLGILCQKGLPLSYALDMNYSYNHILVLTASLGIFYGFKYMKPKKTAWITLLCKAAPYTFGVYLLHENLAVRNLWPLWFGVDKVRGTMLFPLHMGITVILVFAAGIVIDYGRSCIFNRAEALFCKNSARHNKNDE